MAGIAAKLRELGAMDYSIIVSARPRDPAPMLYIAPYTGAAMGEYLMYKGRHVLIVYDDLSHHAVAYRELSLLLHRPPGREAYPGDVFLSPLQTAGAGRLPQRRKRRRQHDRPAYSGDPGGRYLRLYPHQRHFHHRRPNIPGGIPVQLRRAPGN